ncbi:MAG: TolC family protein [Thermoguttaceae bacterium]|jgi:outer membrane protein TolC|nr:TolC family protein [Thermoguttaceae bacterium]
MNGFSVRLRAWVGVLVLAAAPCAPAQEERCLVLPEQRHLEVRDPSRLPRARIPDLPAPRTVSTPGSEEAAQKLSLDEAIRIALDNTRAVRVLAGVTAVNSGRTIYGPAITNTQIDQARARFDPTLQMGHRFSQQDQPEGFLLRDPVTGQLLPPGAAIGGLRSDQYGFDLGVAKDTALGGTAELGVWANPSQSDLSALNPQTPSSLDMRYTQPLLQGAGVQVNEAPIVIARIETERSFFETKGAVQDMVQGVIEAYWALVAARVEVWARRRQVEQGAEGLNRAQAMLDVRLGDAGQVAQARAALANFRANLVTAEANALQREAALRNILGLPPSGGEPLVPVTPFCTERLPTDWDDLVRLAEERRPDIVELKLILEADQQRLLQARNQALPRLDATALYRWNGLEGRTPAPFRERIASAPGEFTEWELGVNFSVPLGLRRGRASLRQHELLLMQDRANLDQGLHAAAHRLAASVRNLAQYYEQYRAFAEAREASRLNLERQLEDYRQGRPTLFLNVLQAITDWGNAVNAEAQALAQYNIELANLERETGTILETHGVRFLEERFCAIGPLGRLGPERPYPMATRPSANEERYPKGQRPSEESLEIQAPEIRRRKPE